MLSGDVLCCESAVRKKCGVRGLLAGEVWCEGPSLKGQLSGDFCNVKYKVMGLWSTEV